MLPEVLKEAVIHFSLRVPSGCSPVMPDKPEIHWHHHQGSLLQWYPLWDSTVPEKGGPSFGDLPGWPFLIEWFNPKL